MTPPVRQLKLSMYTDQKQTWAHVSKSRSQIRSIDVDRYHLAMELGDVEPVWLVNAWGCGVWYYRKYFIGIDGEVAQEINRQKAEDVDAFYDACQAIVVNWYDTRTDSVQKKVQVLLGESSEQPPRRSAIPDEVKILVWRRDEGRCTKCGSAENLEFDHIIPVSKGGSSTARNLQLLCEPCNRRKGANLA